MIFIKYFFRNQPELVKAHAQNVPKVFYDFMTSLKASHLVTVGGRKYFFCHAGIKVGRSLELQGKNRLIGKLSCDNFYDNYAGEDLIVVGHKSPNKLSEQFDGNKPLKVPDKNILMLDTRAKKKDGKLSCVDILSGQYWQSDDAAVKVMFVCAWNTCRSAMAEYIMRHLLKTAGLDKKIHVDSAGCVTEGGEPIGRRTGLTLKANNIPIGEHISKPFTKHDYKTFDCIVALDEDILRHMQRRGDPDKKIRLLADAKGNKISVKDPGCGGGEHSKTYEEIYRGCEALLAELKDKLS